MTVRLPEKYILRMKETLGEDFDAYIACFEDKKYAGLRVNTNKISVEEFVSISPFPLETVPWTTDGFYVPVDERPAKHPYYAAGLYYLQEPSAMLPGELLGAKPGEKVLDVCAAPGGKSTKLLCSLENNGVLLSNDVSFSRAQALLKNLELFGSSISIVTAETPEKLSGRFAGWFDRILIDAPCSGEGMFRKDPAVVKSWEEHGTSFYVPIQRSILRSCLDMLKPGGTLVYSTCTFSTEEDEGAVLFAKSVCPELSVISPSIVPEGALNGFTSVEGVNDESFSNCLRLYPHKLKGEGHFVAVMKKGEPSDENITKTRSDSKIRRFPAFPASVKDFLSLLPKRLQTCGFEENSGYLYAIPDDFPNTDKLRLLRKGLLLGTMKKDRFEPSQALAMTLSSSEFPNVLSLSVDDDRVVRYLKGETIDASDFPYLKDGWVLICLNRFPLGFGKALHGTVKNKYLPGWRTV